ncbi:MAG: TIGR04283 family arsenosugar biosynthesis glycosyltransferase [Bacteroidota bacterium]
MISVIIPTYNEEPAIGSLLQHLRKIMKDRLMEVIVVDSGSEDATVTEAKRNGARVVHSTQKGRALQMNEGAKVAKGRVLYFLHADTFPPETVYADICTSIQAGYKAGCFQLAFDWDHSLLKAFAWCTRLDWDVFRFGDQSLFIEASLFKNIGGFDTTLTVMEDQEVVRRIKKRASFTVCQNKVITSARKYKMMGVLRLQLIFTVIVALYYAGVSQSVIVHFYWSQLKQFSCYDTVKEV